MNDKRENKLSRNVKVETFLNGHEAELAVGAPALTIYSTQYKAKNVELINYAQEANEDITGSSVQKTYLRNLMRDLAIAVSGGLHSHFIITKDSKAAKKAYLTKSEVDNARDMVAHFECKRILEIGQANAASILPLGVTAGMLSDLSDAIDAYYAYIQDPQDEREEKTSALKMFDIAMAESDEILTIIKGIMLTQKESFPMLYMQFLGACAIDDMVGGGSPSVPDFEFSVMPGAYYTAVTIPYLSTRKFKASNMSPTASIEWGLSDLEGSLTNPPVPLNNGATSTLLSTTLGGSGDFLIFYNPSGEPVSVELTVIED